MLKQVAHVLQFSLYLLRDCCKKISGVLYLVQCVQTRLERNCHNFTSVVCNCKSKFRMTKHVMLCFLQSRNKLVLNIYKNSYLATVTVLIANIFDLCKITFESQCKWPISCERGYFSSEIGSKSIKDKGNVKISSSY